MAGVRTFVCPCDTISKIASVATSKDISEYTCSIFSLSIASVPYDILKLQKESINRIFVVSQLQEMLVMR